MPASFSVYFRPTITLRRMSTGIMVNASRMAAAHPAGGKGTQLNILLIQPNTGTGIRGSVDDERLHQDDDNEHPHETGVQLQIA